MNILHLLHQHVAQSVVLLIHREYGCIWNLCILGDSDPGMSSSRGCALIRVRRSDKIMPDTHFFSPLSNKNDSKRAGAFMMTPSSQLQKKTATKTSPQKIFMASRLDCCLQPPPSLARRVWLARLTSAYVGTCMRVTCYSACAHV